MLARSLVVLLLMLNLGVALWWLARPAPIEPPPAPLPPGAVRLQLLDEAPHGVLPATLAASPASVQAEAADGDAGEPRCFRFGPFAEARTAARARDGVLSQGAARALARAEPEPAARGWSVSLPPLADRAAAEAMAARIRGAGFDDLYIVPAGAAANSIALGRYGNEASARQRAQALQAAGFGAQPQPIGEAGTRHWIDVVAGPAFDLAQARAASGAAQAEAAECPPPG